MRGDNLYYLAVRDKNTNEVKDVFGYLSMMEVLKAAGNKYPDSDKVWKMSVPPDYSGEIHYLTSEDA